MRARMNINDAAILIGTLMLFFSVIGLALNWVITLPPEYRVGLPGNGSPQALAVTGSTPAAVLPIPSLTPFQALSPTLAPTLPPINETPAESASFLVPVEPSPTATPAMPTPPPLPLHPDRIVIPAIGMDAQILPAAFRLVYYNGLEFQQWEAPTQYAAGWQYSSAPLGVPGNTVLNGHHNVYGSVFGRLVDLVEGDIIQVYSGSSAILYEVKNTMILPEEGQDLSVRLYNASWLESSEDERLTLVTCWPQMSNSHRLIIVAVPVQKILNGGGQVQ